MQKISGKMFFLFILFSIIWLVEETTYSSNGGSDVEFRSVNITFGVSAHTNPNDACSIDFETFEDEMDDFYQNSVKNISCSIDKCTNLQTMIDCCNIVAANILHVTSWMSIANTSLEINCKIVLSNSDSKLGLEQNNTITTSSNRHPNIDTIILSGSQSGDTSKLIVLPILNDRRENYNFIIGNGFGGSIIVENIVFTQYTSDDYNDPFSLGFIFNVSSCDVILNNVQFDQIENFSIIYSWNSYISITNAQFTNITGSRMSSIITLSQNSFLILENISIVNIMITSTPRVAGSLINVGFSCQVYCVNCTIKANTYAANSAVAVASMIECAGDNGMIAIESSWIHNNIGNIININNANACSIYLNSSTFTKNNDTSVVYAFGESNQNNMYNIENSSEVIIENCTFESNRGDSGVVIKSTSDVWLDIRINRSSFCDNDGSDGTVLHLWFGFITIIDCYFYNNKATSGAGGVLFVGDTNTGLSEIRLLNSRLVNNTAIWSGALEMATGTLYASNCVFTDNYASYGGGAMHIGYWTTSSVDTSITIQATIKHCTMNGNRASGDGGAVLVYTGNVDVIDCNFKDNFAWDGGAIAVGNGSSDAYDYTINIYVYNCIFESNTGEYLGGAMSIESIATNFVLENCTLINNIAMGDGTNGYGGGIGVEIWSKDSEYMLELYIINNKFLNNYADSHGGAIWSHHADGGNEVIHIVDCQFTDNTVDGYGGAMAVFRSHVIADNTQFEDNWARNGAVFSLGFGVYYDLELSLTANNCTFINNYASNTGGVMYVLSIVSHIGISNSIVENNYAKRGGAFIRVALISFQGESYAVRNLNQETIMVINTTNNHFINNTAFRYGPVYSIEVLLDQKSQSFFHAQL